MKRSMAARSWSISCLSSWSLAPRSSALRSASSALRRAAWASEILPSSYAEAFRARCHKKGIALGITRIGVHAGPAIVGNLPNC